MINKRKNDLKKNVFQAKEKLELFDKNGGRDGLLEKDDAIFVLKNSVINGKDCFTFRVIKYFETPKEFSNYTCESEFFRPYEETSGVDDQPETTLNQPETQNTNQPKQQKTDYSVPALIGGGFGVFGFFMAKRFNKNKLLFASAGLIGGALLGFAILKYNKKK